MGCCFVLVQVTRLELAIPPRKSSLLRGPGYLWIFKKRGYTAFLGGGSAFEPGNLAEHKKNGLQKQSVFLIWSR